MGGARRHCHCNLNDKRSENIITVDSALFKFNVAKISTSIFESKPGNIRHLAEISVSLGHATSFSLLYPYTFKFKINSCCLR